MKITVPFEGTKNDLESIAKKYKAVVTLVGSELSIIASPLCQVDSDEENITSFIKGYMSALGIIGDYQPFIKTSNDRIFVYWEKLGEAFSLSYYKGEDAITAVTETVQKPGKNKKSKKSTDEDEIIILKAPEVEKPKITLDLSRLC